MPKFKQPIPLQRLAFNCLVAHAVYYCDQLSVSGLLSLLCQSVAEIKQHVCNYLPSILFADYCRRFLDKFYSIGVRRSEKRPASHHRAVLEIMMDVKVIGLVCEGGIARYLDSSEAHRLQRLKILDWTELQSYECVTRSLKNFRLQDLTTFVYPRMCTDLDLEIIGSRCSKLQILRIEESENVTDRGLRALHLCSELRIVNLHYCSVSDHGVNELLNVHKKLEEFNVSDYFTCGEESFDLLSRPISSMCPSVKRFALKSDPVTNDHLRSVVALFPNLTYLEFCCPFIGDLAILRNLKSLAKLDFGYSSGGFSMENLRKLLISVGPNVSRLTLCSAVSVSQSDIDFIFKTCGDIEYLNFHYRSYRSMEKLVIPPFRKLKHLICVGCLSRDNRYFVLEFSQMSNLEILGIQHFDAIFEMTESMMLDHAKFPNLREVRTSHNYHDHEIINRITKIARIKNLNFSLVPSR